VSLSAAAAVPFGSNKIKAYFSLCTCCALHAPTWPRLTPSVPPATACTVQHSRCTCLVCCFFFTDVQPTTVLL
jgi:hypothetical protein